MDNTQHMILIGRPINGVTINGNEYVLDSDGSPMEFPNEEVAREFLHDHGIADAGIVFEEMGELEDE